MTLGKSDSKQFIWDDKRILGAELYAAGKPIVHICVEIGLGRHTFHEWLKFPVFQRKVRELQVEWEQRAKDSYFAQRAARIEVLSQKLDEIEEIRLTRAKSYLTPDGEIDWPASMVSGGGHTGHIVHTYKVVGNGDSAYTVKEYASDTALMKEYRLTLEQLAKEAGDRETRALPNTSSLAEQVVITERQVFHLPPRDIARSEQSSDDAPDE